MDNPPSTNYRAEPVNWFLRGVQSAVFYYVSCSPWLEYKHKRNRRREADEQAQERLEVVTTQPGLVRQPAPFQTNEAWAEELMLGPGPPKGWKKDTLLDRIQKKIHPGDGGSATSQQQATESSTRPSTRSSDLPTQPSVEETNTARHAAHIKENTDTSAQNPKPGMERRLSNAMENFKDTLRTTLHPPKWNWKRYDREDEILTNFTGKVSKLWNRATAGMSHDDTEDAIEFETAGPYRRRRAATNESERYDYNRTRNPALNDLHPPIVSQLPASRAEAAWMLLPPPSAAVMEARMRPAAQPEMRWPLCVVGRPVKAADPRPSLAKTLSTENVASEDFVESTETEEREEYFSEGDLISDIEPTPMTGPRVENQSPTRIKHLSDPIIRPPPVHPVSRFAGDLLMPKRRDSWQFHYVVPANQAAL
jgi:hypothetical protein